jgi:hypothetical protein
MWRLARTRSSRLSAQRGSTPSGAHRAGQRIALAERYELLVQRKGLYTARHILIAWEVLFRFAVRIGWIEASPL